MKIFVTGAAGFIGYHLCKRLIKNNYDVVGLDNLNAYYDVKLKLNRLEDLGIDVYDIASGKNKIQSIYNNFKFIKGDLQDSNLLSQLFETEKFSLVCNLAAQAGVRYSIDNPMAYIDSNVVGFANILECCRNHDIGHLVYASSSSVYGMNKDIPFSVDHKVDKPVSLYAATKKSNELMAHTYSHLYGLKTTGLRFFTVYGPWGRPDMAYFLFAKAILSSEPIKVFNEGKLSRDFTYIDDIIEGIYRIISSRKDTGDKYAVYNIGSNAPTNLMDFIHHIENALDKKAIMEMYPMQQGDVYTTYANVQDLMRDFGYAPTTSLKDGIDHFIKWYKSYYN